MLAKIYRALNIEEDEKTSVLLLLGQSLFLGIFLATYDVGATTLFLDAFPSEMLPKSFIVSGIIGMILSIIYSKLQQSISFVKLALINLIIIACSILAMRYAFELTDNKWLSFIVFIMMGPLNAIALLGFWGVAGRLFSIRQAKRLFGMIDSGQIFGMVLTSFLIPVVLLLTPRIHNLLLISGVSVLGTFILQVILTNKLGKNLEEESSQEEDDNQTKGVTYLEMFQKPYIRLLAFFVVSFMVGAFLVYGSFMGVVKVNFPNQIDTANFLSIFTAVVMIFTFLIKTFLFAKLMSTYGLRFSLLLSPIVVGALLIIAAVVGTLLGYELKTAGFVFFFLLIAMSRLFSQSLSMAIQAPTLNILYQPLSVNIRYDVQAKINGTINELSSVLSGLILLGLGSLSFFKPIHVPYLLIFIFVLWIWVIISLYKEYQNTLKKSLESADEVDQEELEIVKVMLEEFEQPTINTKTKHVLRVFKEIEPLLFEDLLLESVKHPNIELRKYAIQLIGEMKIVQAIDKIQEQLAVEKDIETKTLLEKSITLIYEEGEDFLSNSYLEQLVYSRKTEHRVYACKLLTLFVSDKNKHYLLDLIRDIEPEVRLAAIVTAGQVGQQELFPFLIDNLANEKYYSASKSALLTIGVEALPILENVFDRSGTNIHLLARIVEVMTCFGEEASDYLITKINYPEPLVQQATLKALSSLSIEVKDDTLREKIRQVLKQFIGAIFWNKMAISELRTKVIGSDLKEAIENENKENYEQVFSLLALLFDAKSVGKIQTNIELGTTESIGYAIELLDLILEDYLKQLLFPILEDLSINEMNRQLQTYFPRESFDEYEILIEIINRDYNLLGKWSKACALEALNKMKQVEISYDIIANLFNPNSLLRQESGRLLFNLDKEQYKEVFTRLGGKEQQELRLLLESKKIKEERFLLWKTRYLKKLDGFRELSWDILVEIASCLRFVPISDNVNVWKENDYKNNLLFFIDGNLRLNEQGKESIVVESEQFIGDYLLWENEKNNPLELHASKATNLFMIDTVDWLSLMNRFPKLAYLYIYNTSVSSKII
ncbi:MAG: hypothetical protein GY827_06650 [Cytophagales bacterium]|nr:hypothetical protein [Cytophagales bacterium]